jgi:hypothetical protein
VNASEKAGKRNHKSCSGREKKKVDDFPSFRYDPRAFARSTRDRQKRWIINPLFLLIHFLILRKQRERCITAILSSRGAQRRGDLFKFQMLMRLLHFPFALLRASVHRND